jgi:molybdopterin molybdotransferase
MAEFLILNSPEQALKKWFSALPVNPQKTEEIDSFLGLNRFTSAAICSKKPSPEFSRSTVDGYAVRAVDTFGAGESLPAYFSVVGEVPMGKKPEFAIAVGNAALIHTGGMLPVGANAVVMLEYTQLSKNSELEVVRAIAPNENVIQMGEDVAAGQVVIPAGSRLRPAEIGGLMSMGQLKVQVVCRPVIGILSSGDEVIEPTIEPQPGQVRDINSYSLAAQIEEWGGTPIRLGIIPDREEQLRIAMTSALESCDAVIVTAGSSASVRDLTAQVIDGMGSPGVLVHGVNIHPGKPTILAVCNGKAVVGLPGNPVSALVIARRFVKPLIEYLSGCAKGLPLPTLPAILTVNLSSQSGREDWWPVRLLSTPQAMNADPIFYKSNLIFNYTQADGLIQITADATGLIAGSHVDVYLL